jgi:hypothetical protein
MIISCVYFSLFLCSIFCVTLHVYFIVVYVNLCHFHAFNLNYCCLILCNCRAFLLRCFQVYLCVKVKVKLSLYLTKHCHEDVWGSGCGDPLTPDLGASWRSVVSSTPRPLCPRGKSPRYPLDRRLGGPQNRSGQRGENS